MSTKAEVSTMAPKEMSFVERQTKRIKRLRSLHSARNQARKQNHQEVVAEEARNKLLDDQAERQDAEEAGKNYARVNLLHLLSAVEAEQLERKKRKNNPNEKFSTTYKQATVRLYNRLVENMSPADVEQYEKQKQMFGDAFYGGSNETIHGMHEDREEAIDKMVNDLLEEQIVKRARYSRSRGHFDDADYYINDKNAKFNKKLEFEDWKLGTFYGGHTAGIKQNLELPFSFC